MYMRIKWIKLVQYCVQHVLLPALLVVLDVALVLELIVALLPVLGVALVPELLPALLVALGVALVLILVMALLHNSVRSWRHR